jgi:polyisoprenoid-binding protein YceI
MQSKVLESSMYPDIVFRSTEVRRTGALVLGVSGDLTLHGVTKPVSFDVTRQNDSYVGTIRIGRRSLAFSRSKSAAVSSG